MTQEDIVRMAREAGLNISDRLKDLWMPQLERFAALVAAHEREKRTQELMQLFLDPENQPTQYGTVTLAYMNQHVLAEREACAKVCEEVGPKEASLKLITEGFAAAIRARSR